MLILVLLLAPASPARAGGYRFAYRFEEGDVWKMTERSETSTEVMGTKSLQRVKRRTLYKVVRDLGKGWYRIAAEVTEQTNWDESGASSGNNPLAGMRFTAEIHTSGALRRYRFTGGDPQTARFIGPAMKAGIFFFPEFPDEPLEPGDDFDYDIKIEMPGMMGMGATTSVMRMTYTLEDVSDGVAVFSVRQRMKIKGSGMKFRTGGKSEALFDLEEGMWVEHETRTRSRGGAGFGAGGVTLQRSRVTLEKK